MGSVEWIKIFAMISTIDFVRRLRAIEHASTGGREHGSGDAGEWLACLQNELLLIVVHAGHI